MSEVERLRLLLAQTKTPSARSAIVDRMRAVRAEESQTKDRLKLYTQIKGCRACPLGRTRKHAVPFSGPTHGNGDLILVGEAPGPNEDKEGVPFVGRAGKALDRMLEMAGTSRERCFVMNALCCLPNSETESFREPTNEELSACRPNFEDQLEISGLKVGVALGGYAWGAVTGQERQIIQVGKLVKGEKTAWVDGRIWIPTFHPSYALRKNNDEDSPTITDYIVNSLRWALAMRWGTTLMPKLPIEKIQWEGYENEDLRKGLEVKGWALVESQTLGCQVLVVGEKIRKKIPRELKELIPQYTVEELVKIGLIGAESGWSVGDLRRLHYVKVEMGGEVIA